MSKLVESVVLFVIFLGIIAGLSLLFTYPLMWLINGTFSAAFLAFIFGGPITFWKAFSLSILIGLLRPSSSNSKN